MMLDCLINLLDRLINPRSIESNFVIGEIARWMPVKMKVVKDTYVIICEAQDNFEILIRFLLVLTSAKYLLHDLI